MHHAGGRQCQFQRPPFCDGRASSSAWPQNPERGDVGRRVADRSVLCGAARSRQALGRGRPPARSVSNQQNHAERITVARGIEISNAFDDSSRRSIAKRLDTQTRYEAGTIRAGVGGTRPAIECPQATSAVATATANSPGRPDRSPGSTALSGSAPAAIVTRAPVLQAISTQEDNSNRFSAESVDWRTVRASSLSES